MKIATLGSCQAMALNWYLLQLFPECKSKWVCSEHFKHWGDKSDSRYEDVNNDSWRSQVDHNIFDTGNGIDYIKSADYIIYQKIKPSLKSPLFNYDKIKSYAKSSAKLVSFSYIQYNKNVNDPLKGMMEREKILSQDIKISNIILENPNRGTFKFNREGNHFNSSLFLEILREVCKKLEWSFFNDDMYTKIKDQHYPFGKM